MDEGVVQEWNSWVWAAETDSIEELIFYTDGAAQLTMACPRRVTSARWNVVVFGISHDGAHRRLLGAACAPCMLEGQFSTSPQQQQSDSCSKRRTPAPSCDVSAGSQDAGSTPTLPWPTSRVVRGQRYDGCRVLRPSTFAAIQESRATSARVKA